MKDMLEALEKLGMGEKEGKVYIALVQNYYRTMDEVILSTQLNEKEVKESIEILISKGFVRKIPGKIDFYVALSPNIVIVATAQEQIEQDFQKLQDNVKIAWTTAKTTLSDSMTSLYGSLENYHQAFITTTKEESSKHSDKLQTFVDEFKTKNEEKILTLESNAEKKLKSRHEGHTKFVETQIEELLKLLKEEINKVNQELSSIQDETLTTLTDIKEGRLNSVKDFEVKLKETLKTDKERINSFLTKFQRTYGESLQKTIGDLAENYKAFQTIIQDQGKDAFEEFTSKLTVFRKFIDEIQSKSVERISTVKETVDGLKTTYEQRLLDVVDQFTTSTKEEINKLEETMTQNMKQPKEARNSIRLGVNQLDEHIKAITKQIDDSLAKFENQFIENLSSQFEIAGKIFSEFDETVNINLKNAESKQIEADASFSKEANSLISEAKKHITETSTKTKENVTMKLKDVENDIQTKTTDLLDNFIQKENKLLETVVEFFNSQSATSSKDSISKITELTKKLTEEIGSLQTNCKTAFEKIEATVKNAVAEEIIKAKDENDSILTKLANESIPATKETIHQQISDGTTTVKDKTQETQDKLTKQLSEVKERIITDKEESTEKLKSTTEEEEKITKNEFTSLLENLNKTADDLSNLPDKLQLIQADYSNRISSMETSLLGFTGELKEFFDIMLADKILRKKQDWKEKVDSLQIRRDEIEKSLGDLIQDFSVNFKEEVDIASDDILSNVNTLKEKSQKNIQQAQERVLDLYIKNIEKKVKIVEESSSIHNKEIEEFASFVTDLATGVGTDLETVFGTMKGDFDSGLNKGVEEIRGFSAKIVTTINDVTNMAFEDIHNQIELVDTEFIGFLNNVNDTIKETGTQTAEGIKNAVESQTADIMAKSEEINQSLGEMTSSIKKLTNESITTNIEETIKDVSEAFNQFESSETHNIETKTQILAEIGIKYVKNARKNLDGIKQDLSTTIEETTKGNVAQKEALTNEIRELTISLKKHSYESLQESLAKTTNALGTIETNLFSAIDNIEKTTLNSTKTLVESIKKGKSTSDQGIKQLMDQISSSATQIGTHQDAIANELSKLANTIDDQIKQATKTGKSSIQELRKKQLYQLKTKNDEWKANLKSQIDTVLVKGIADSIKSIGKDFETIESNINAINSEYLTLITQQAENYTIKARSIATKPTTALENKFLASKNTLQEFVGKESKELLTAINDVVNDYNEELTTLKTEIEEFSTSLSGSGSAVIEGDLQKMNTNSTNTLKQIKGTLDNTSTNLAGTIEEEFKQIPNVITEGLKETGSVMKFLKSIKTLATKTDQIAVEKTWFIAGEQRCIDYINGAIRRTTRMSKFLFPKISLLNNKMIKEIPSTKRLDGIIGNDNPDYVKEIGKNFTNISLREYPIKLFGFVKDIQGEAGIAEGGIGAGGELLVTYDQDLIEAINEIFQNYYPKSKKLT